MESSSGSEAECAFACMPNNCPLSDSGVKCCTGPQSTKTVKVIFLKILI